ncbi:MAG: iron-containing alcohol dehydrogenase [Clostridiaceae bacterium]|nr:iron-containing alcohol dehydrogenase [Clostridiaceae bacterium]
MSLNLEPYNKTFTFDIPTRALFGPGRLNDLHAEKMPGKKAMIVVIKGMSPAEMGFLARTEEQLHLAGAETIVFDKIEANPTKSAVEEGAALARQNKCDFIVALGGGSSMDAAKAIALLSANEGDLWDYAGAGTGKSKVAENDPLPIIAIATTSGTGSETDGGAVITKVETNEKMGIVDYRMFPVIAIVDPELTYSVPPRLTAFQGFDALFHSAEGYISKVSNLISDMYAIAAIENAGRYLARAVKNGNDTEAREKVAFASYISGVEMVLGGVSGMHALEHALSGYYPKIPHGAGLIMLSKAFFTHFIAAHVCDDRFIHMAKLMGMEEASEPMDFITMLEKLMEECGVADIKMSDYGVDPQKLDEIAAHARYTEGGILEIDRKVLSVEECADIYKKAFK